MSWQSRTYLLIAPVLCAVCFALVSATMSDSILKVPLFDVGSIWVNAVHNLTVTVTETPDFKSPWTYMVGTCTAVFAYYFYYLAFVPMNRIRLLGDLGYIPEGKSKMKEVANRVRQMKMAGDCPPVYPNGWFSVMESRDLKTAQVRSVDMLGLHLAVFRGDDGTAYVIDAYCPHLGANLGVGGMVYGNCLECPFHGWKFRGEDGKCMHIPYNRDSTCKIPDVANVKAYSVLERNGFIYFWYHAEGIEPTWMPPILDEVESGLWKYGGRTEHHVNAHIEEVPENGADVAHLGHLHSPFMTTGVDLRYTREAHKFAKHVWGGEWQQNSAEDEKHIGTLTLTHTMTFFGFRIPFLDMQVKAQQIGPGIVYLTFVSPIARGAYLQSLVPLEPLTLKMVHHVYMHWAVPSFIIKFFLLGEALMVERDIMVWNNKRYQGKPVYLRTPEDAMIQRHRRWYSQFYSEHSVRLKSQKDTLEW